MTAMLNMDFSRRVVIRTRDLPWQPSPRPGVWRKPLAREEAERGHATSIVRYDPGASFQRHGHPLGEEILVLEGTFSDEHGDFGAGTYFRNAPGSGHAPFSKEGCTLLVKLHQFLPDDGAQVCVDTSAATWLADEAGIEAIPLHRFAGERVALMKWRAGAARTLPSSSRRGGDLRPVGRIEGRAWNVPARYMAAQSIHERARPLRRAGNDCLDQDRASVQHVI